MTDFSRYGALDRILHRLAFASAPIQKALADMEDRMFAPGTESSPPPRPVFITALPRAGTTLLLNILAAAPDFATQCYRDMPFLFTPILWSRLSRSFRLSAEMRERAHGDGVAVGFDSPEAFEEAYWCAFWPEKYGAERIEPWRRDERNPEFEAFFYRHMRKIIAVRGENRKSSPPHRYLSKNNGNIARLPLLPVLFPDCRIVVPLRSPFAHARSLQRQHRRFKDMHASDPFARRYMTALGHFEFGEALRPIGFTHKLGDPDSIGFWLRYWLAAHEAIRAAPSECLVFVDHENLCARPVESVQALCQSLAIDPGPEILEAAAAIRRPTDDARHRAPDAGSLLGRAARLFEALRRRAINAPAAGDDDGAVEGIARKVAR